MSQYFETVWQAVQNPSNAVYNLTYLLLLLSVMMRNISWLRVLAIGSGLAKIGFQLATNTNAMESFWESVLVLVNVLQLVIIWWDNRRRGWTARQKQFLSNFDPPLPHSAAATLLRSGFWHEAPAGVKIIEEGQPVSALLYVSAGAVNIEVGGGTVGQCSTGDFLGEMTWQSGNPATATAIAAETVLYLRFGRDSLERAMKQRPVLQYALQTSFNKNLIDKIVRSNENRAMLQTAQA